MIWLTNDEELDDVVYELKRVDDAISGYKERIEELEGLLGRAKDVLHVQPELEGDNTETLLNEIEEALS